MLLLIYWLIGCERTGVVKLNRVLRYIGPLDYLSPEISERYLRVILLLLVCFHVFLIEIVEAIAHPIPPANSFIVSAAPVVAEVASIQTVIKKEKPPIAV